MFINVFTSIMIAFILLSVYVFVNNTKDEIKVENFEPSDNQYKKYNPKNNFIKQFHDKQSIDNLKLQKLVNSYEKLTPCCGGYFKPGNFGFKFD